MKRRRVHATYLVAFALAGLLAAVAGTAAAKPEAQKAVTLNLVAYSTPRPVLTKLIEEYRKTPQGDDVTIRASYGPSSAQGQAVANGLPADGVILNTGNDMIDLVNKGKIGKNWDKQSYNGVVWNSVVAFGLRDGNPKKIKGWNDTTRSGVGNVTVNPFTGGIAKWNVLAAYVAQRKLGKTEKQAIAWLQEFYKSNVVAQEASGSNATNAFLAGRGDVLLTFESEAINGKIPYVIPKQTMLIDVYIAAIEGPEQGRVEQVLAVPEDVPGPEDPGRERLSPCQQAGARGVPQEVPEAGRRDADQRQAARRLACRHQEVLRSEQECHAADLQVPRDAHWLARSPRRRGFRRPSSTARREPQGLSPCRWGSSRRSCS